MKIGRRRQLLLAAVALAMAVAAPTAAQAAQRPTRTLVALPGLPNIPGSNALDVNNSGVAVGWAGPQGVSHAVKWPTPFSVVELPNLPYATSAGAYGINNNGVVVGVTYIEHKSYATKWSTDGTVHELGTPPDHRTCIAKAINDNDVAVGRCVTDAGAGRAVRWAADGSPTVLDTGDRNVDTNAVNINSSGVVVGMSENLWATRWDTDGLLRGMRRPDNADYSFAHAINSRGEVAGAISTAESGAVRWAAGGDEWTHLARLPGSEIPTGSGSDINDDGTVVGDAYTADGWLVGVRWAANGAATRLPSLPNARPAWGNNANAINSTGVIAGHSGGDAVLWLGYR